jgi:hypothetical protein
MSLITRKITSGRTTDELTALLSAADPSQPTVLALLMINATFGVIIAVRVANSDGSPDRATATVRVA